MKAVKETVALHCADCDDTCFSGIPADLPVGEHKRRAVWLAELFIAVRKPTFAPARALGPVLARLCLVQPRLLVWLSR